VKRPAAAFELYLDHAREYRWRLKARNGRIIADSGEGYSTKRNARRAVFRMMAVVGMVRA
jgi:uncharacterized protein YegP (UPF0339 family)